MIAIIDYGVGNLFSLKCSFASVGADVIVTGDRDVIRKADKLILPGVGAFEDAAAKLFSSGLHIVIKERVEACVPLLGICLGMQMLFEKSYEYGEHNGLGLIKGSIVPLQGSIPATLNIPHIGWNALDIKKSSPILKYINDGDCVYFVHSYYAVDCDENVCATAEYGTDVTACVQYKNVFGCQFHPEKSGAVGLDILRAFCELEMVI